jgi:hypothetical protein
MQPAFSSSSPPDCCACALRRLGLPPLRGVVEPFFPDRVGDLSRVFFGEVEPRVLRLGVVVDALGEGAGIRLSRLEGGEGTGDMMVTGVRGVTTSVTYPLSLEMSTKSLWMAVESSPPGGMDRKTLFRLAWMSAAAATTTSHNTAKTNLKGADQSKSVEMSEENRAAQKEYWRAWVISSKLN